MVKFASRTALRLSAAGLLLGLLSFGHIRAQAAPEQVSKAPSITVTARIVVLDVVVTDKKGNLVQRTFDKGDFTIYEGGKPQTIRSFEPPSAHVMPNAGQAIVNSAADLTKIGDAPVTILVLDELNSRFEDMSYSRQMLVKYLLSQPAALKEPTLMLVATNTSFQQLHDYTQNRDALVQIVKKRVSQFPWKMDQSGKQGAGAVERMAQVLSALQQIAQSSQGTPGRKNLIWVGNGFPSADLVGLPNEEGDKIETAIRRVTSKMLASRITMYSINPTPDASSTVALDDPTEIDASADENGGDPFGAGSVSFMDFATSTGGIAFTGRNDLNNVIAEGIAKGQDYYTLSYTPTGDSEAAAKFRNIRVVMKDPNLRATTRDGYYPDAAGDLNAVTDKTMDAKQVQANLKLDLSNALLSTISYNGLSVKAVKSANGLWVLNVAPNGVGWTSGTTDASQHSEATVAAAWYDAKGKLLGHVAREEVFKRVIQDGDAVYTLPVETTAGAVRLRFVVRDAINGHMGTVDLTQF